MEVKRCVCECVGSRALRLQGSVGSEVLRLQGRVMQQEGSGAWERSKGCFSGKEPGLGGIIQSRSGLPSQE